MTTPSGPAEPPDRQLGDATPGSTAMTPGAPTAQPPGPQSYQGYSAYPPYPMPRPTNGLAIASLVLGIIWVYWVGSILALIFGYVARRQIRERGEGGDGLAIAGIVLGWVGVGFLGLFLIFLIIGIASGA